MMDIYYVEDDENIGESVEEFLSRRGFRVFVFSTVGEAKTALGNNCPALALVDWNMPDGSGNMLCAWIREKWKELPVIFLTVRDDPHDMVSGFKNGADDYVVKPFELEVLFSRIQALLRRTGNVSEQYLSCGGISVDQKRMTAAYSGEEISLSRSEYQLLLYLLQNKGRTVTREMLLEAVWDRNGDFVNDNTLTVAMKRLREKLHQPACLKTVRSIGYRMEEPR